VCDLPLAIEDVDRHEDHAELHAGEEKVDELDAVGEMDAEAVALRVAALLQRVRDAIAPRLELAERIRMPLPLQCGRPCARDEREVEEVKEVHTRQIADSKSRQAWFSSCFLLSAICFLLS